MGLGWAGMAVALSGCVGPPGVSPVAQNAPHRHSCDYVTGSHVCMESDDNADSISGANTPGLRNQSNHSVTGN